MADTRLGKIGITVKEPWAVDISYEMLDMTLYSVEDGGDGCSYVALKDNIGVTPGTDPTTWVKSTQAGQSIYDLAVKYKHFEGTEEEFEAEYQAVLQAARDAAAGASAVEAQVEAAEAARVEAETGRVDAESARQSAEASRASAETARGTAEAARQSAEASRASAETARVTAEQGRVSAESDRVSAEAARAAAETDRVSDFSALKTDMETAIGQADAATAAAVATNNQIQTAEAGRVSAEQGRVSAETARASAESARATAESGRATAETARVTAEGQRATAEGQRVTAENARVSAESGRDTAESARVTAEAARVSAETARESQASSDHTRAEEDHAIVQGYDNRLTNVEGEVSQLGQKVDENAMISNSLAGLVFNDSPQHQKAKNAIKAIWLTYGPYISDEEKPLVDALRNNLISLSTEIQITYLYNISGTYGCMLRIVDANNATCFQKYVAGIHTISRSEEVWDISVNANTVLYPNNSGISGYPFQLHIAIDWNALSGETITSAGDNPITIIFGDVAWGERVPTISVKDQIEFLSKSSIVGKNIVCFGDSLTEIVDTTNSKHYTDYLADMTGANFINVGIGGSQIRRRLSYDVGVFDASKPYAINDFCIYTNGSDETRLYKFTSAHTGAWDDNDVILAPYQQNAYSLLDIYSLIKASCQQSFTDVVAACKVIKETQSDDNTDIINRLVAIDWSQVDAITIFAGTNDWYNANSLGATGSNDANKTLGAINEIIRLFLTAYPKVKVYWYTPIVRWVSGFNVGTNPPTIDDTKFSDDYSVEGNGTLKEESASIIQEVTKNHIPVCDMYNNFGWNKYNCKLYFVGTDGTHPRTYDGVTYLAKKIGEFILVNNTFNP